MVGRLGDVKFRVSDNKVTTFDGLTYDKSARNTTHEVIGGKPFVEYLGPGLDSMTIPITLISIPGGSVNRDIKKLWNMLETAELNYFIIGNKRIGKQWLVTEVSTTFDVVTNKGKVTEATVNVTLQEYA